MIGVSDAYRKSILFELVNRNTQGAAPLEAFTLTVPPESIEIDEPQRLSQTKTFGGLFLDDYGPDVMRITISGTTGSADLRATYTKNGMDSFNGKTSFFYFRDHLMRYKSNPDYAQYANYDLNIYDLSSSDPVYQQGAGGQLSQSLLTQRYLSDGYVCALVSFKMSRSKERPLWFNYHIELVGLNPLGTVRASNSAPYTAGNPAVCAENIQKLTPTLGSMFGTISDVYDKVQSVTSVAGTFAYQFQQYTTQAINVIAYPMSLAQQLFSAVKSVRDTIYNLPAGAMSAAGLTSAQINTVYMMLGAMARNAADTVAYARTPQVTASASALLSASATGVNQTSTALADVDTSDPAQVVAAVGTSVYVPTRIFGHTLEKITSSTTMEQLALKYYGDLSYVELIALYNNLANDAQLVVGNWIKIPVLTALSINPNNQIYSDNVADVYGADIALDQYGQMLCSGDFGVLQGPMNVVQAMNLRLATTLGARWRLVLYGIKAAIGAAGSNTAPVSYMVANIKDTVLQDPRITLVDAINVKMAGDQLRIGMNLKLVQQTDTIPYLGVI